MTSYLKVSKWSPDLRRSRCRCQDDENQLVAWQEKRTAPRSVRALLGAAALTSELLYPHPFIRLNLYRLNLHVYVNSIKFC